MSLYRLVTHDVGQDEDERYAMYASLEEALAQGDHDRAIGEGTPLRVEDETGATVYAWETS